ncbi:hypothetical protein ACX4MY_00060 [Roseomonas mucosa]|nr:hypothetical protein [Acetobacteraceae bacterium]
MKEAGELLGITRNAVKARITAGKLEGSRDNAGKWWVLIDPSTVANDRPTAVSNSETDISNDSGNDIEKTALFDALTAHIDTLKADLEEARAEIARLRPRAETADRLDAALDALRQQYADKAAEVDQLRKRLDGTSDDLRQAVAAMLAQMATPPPPAVSERPSWLGGWFRWGKG